LRWAAFAPPWFPSACERRIRGGMAGEGRAGAATCEA
jgi:hypothetical protein